MSEIPIQNIYYLLCYAWDRLEEKDLVDVNAQSFKDLPNLFAKVLSNGLGYLFKKGLDRDYVIQDEEYRGIKGKLLISESLKRNTFSSGRAYCSFDEFEYDVLHNRILKATLCNLVKYPELDESLREEVRLLHQRFHNVTSIQLERKHFSQVRLHRNNQFYRFLMDISLLLYDNLLFDENHGLWRFKDFIRDESKMPSLFEKFIFNFYKRELPKEYAVGVEIIKWQAEAMEGSSLEYLPSMRTDISITSSSRKLILDAKYYKEAMVTHFDKEKFRSQHFYQMYAYVSNLDTIDHEGKTIEAMLVYPTVDKSFSQSYKTQGYKIGFKSLDLRQDWRELEKSLHAIISS